MIHHHPAGDNLLSYSAGALGESWSLAVATHLAYCSVCRETVDGADEMGGVLLEDMAPDPMSAAALSETLSKLDLPEAVAPNALSEDVPLAEQTAVPQPLRNYLDGTFDDIAWESIGSGASQYLIPTGDNAQARLLNIPAGTPVPEHSHGGRELTLVLSGSFSDNFGTFGPGDLEDVDDDTQHRPLAGMDEPCICLAVTDAPLKFKSWVPRLVQPFIGI